jgi:HTH-type transcriptional regulator / antitoxin HigA
MPAIATDRHAIAAAWRALKAAAPVRTIQTEQDLEQVAAFVDSLIDAGATEPEHELHDLLQLLTQHIEAWEDDNIRIPEAEPRSVLRALMDEHGLRQTDLGEIVSQGVLSEILSGKRAISRRTAKLLAERFGVGVQVFI